MSARDKLRFGEPVEGIHASDDNPHKRGFFVRSGKRTGRLNAGYYAEVTDGKGTFWTYPYNAIRKIDAPAYRFLAPGELDPETIERCAQVADRESIKASAFNSALAEGRMNAADEIAVGIRALTDGGRGDG